MWDYLAGEVEYDEMRYRGIVATRQLAKRQMTWLRGWPDVTGWNLVSLAIWPGSSPKLVRLDTPV